MREIDKIELRRLLKIKSDFEKDILDISLIAPEDLESLCILLEEEVKGLDEKLTNVKENIEELYAKMDDIEQSVTPDDENEG